MKVKNYYLCCLVGLLLVACSQNHRVKQQNFPVGESREFIIIPDGLSVQAGEDVDRLVVKIQVAKEEGSGKRFGKVTFNWTGEDSTLSGTVDLSLRKGAASNTLPDCGGSCSTLGAFIESNRTIYTDVTETRHLATTPKTIMSGQLCVDINDWDLSTSATNTDPSYSFNNQPFPLTLCQRNAGEPDADMTVVLDGNSSTESVLGQTFPFIVAVENLGPRPADNVKIIIRLPTIVRFVEDKTTKYNCKENNNNPRRVICTTTERVVPERRALPLILKGVNLSRDDRIYNIRVLVKTDSIETDLSNNDIIQGIKVVP